MRKALITGITGQDGSYLAELLLEKGYAVHGTSRAAGNISKSRIAHLGDKIELHETDLSSKAEISEVIRKAQPNEIYHLAGQSDVHKSFEIPEETTVSIALVTVRLLEVLRKEHPAARLFNAGSSEIFGRPTTAPQNEETPMEPVNPYGCAKAYARQISGVYRAQHKLFACTGIFYNHESPRRGENFVTRKICRAAARIKAGEQSELVLGNTNSQRDWGHAKDFARGMWLALQHDSPEDYIFATGIPHTVQDVIEVAFDAVGLDWKMFVRQDPKLMRPGETHRPLGDASKALRLLGWKPEVTFEQMIREMTLAELATCQQPT